MLYNKFLLEGLLNGKYQQKLFFIRYFFCIFNTMCFGCSFFKKTRNGERYEYFKTETSTYLPQILASYLRTNSIKYRLYKIPNYVIDLLEYNPDFKVAYGISNKYLIIVFQSEKEMAKDKNLPMFYAKLNELLKMYSNSFSSIIINTDEEPGKKYVEKAYNIAYKDLKEYCGRFCLIDSKRKTMFVFPKVYYADLEALEVLFQQYDYMTK